VQNFSPSWYQENFQYLWYPYAQMQTMMPPLPVVSAQGVRINLGDGRSLIDGISSWWSVCHGYQHPHIVEEMQKQLGKISHVMFAGIAHEGAYILAQRLCKLARLEKIFFTDSGSTAIETAMKIAVQYWRNNGHKYRNKFVCFQNGYHGDTMGAMSLSDQTGGLYKFAHAYMPEQYSIPIPADEYAFAEFDSLLAAMARSVAAVVIEPLVQGAGGMRFHTADVLAEISRITKKHGLLLIADEVMTGFYRTGNLFAHQEAGILPDILCVGKALTGGMIGMAAALTTQQVYDAFLGESLDLALMSGPTFMANPLACAAANASLDLFEREPRSKQVEKIEKILHEELSPCLQYKNIIDVRVKGAIAVVQCEGLNWQKIQALRAKAQELGVWLRPFSDVIYVMPPFVISEEDLRLLCGVVRELASGV
jgi:adenosylmethionine-8-amino-7-oxononanoate aminotransferase